MSSEFKTLTKEEFYNLYKTTLNLDKTDFKFLTKSYFEKENLVSLYADELELDCYFILPSFSTNTIPEERAYIYFLPAKRGFDIYKTIIKNNGYSKFVIDVENLIKVINLSEDVQPKSNAIEDDEFFLNLIKQLIDLEKRRCEFLETLLKNIDTWQKNKK